MPSYVSEIIIPKMKEGHSIIPSYPCDKNLHRNAINLICGPNYSGKSYLLRAVCALLHNKTAARKYQGYSVRLSSDEQPRVYAMGKLWREKDSVGIVSLKPKIPRGVDYDYRIFLAKLFVDQLSSQASLLKQFDITVDESTKKTEPITRCSEIINSIPIDEKRLFPCDSENKLVKLIEDFLDLQLYFRRLKEGIEFVQLNNSGSVIPFPEWSDGQKAIFYLLLVIEYYKPCILLIDEIESHLHPKLISKVLLHLKSNIKQSFITSHSPHVMSSTFCDSIFYMEIDKLPFTKKIIDKYTQIQLQKHPTRSITTIDTVSNQILGIYKMFDIQDSELLRQATRMAHVIEIEIISTIIQSFKPLVVDSSGKVNPDIQTLELIKALNLSELDQITLLDYGAGVGRVAKEITKAGKYNPRSNCKWICWEPISEQRQELKEELVKCELPCETPDSIDDIPDSSCEIVLLANVLHELTPRQIADTFVNACNKMKKTGSTMIVFEIYPLLAPEKLAVPYSETYLKRLLNSIGFTSTSRSLSIKGCSAYTVSASVSAKIDKDHNSIVSKVEHVWQEIKQDALSSYFQRPAIIDAADHSAFAQELFTIASIESWQSGLWN